ncbi:MAG: terminase gpA endonuclease subunit [Schlesneria sp.]
MTNVNANFLKDLLESATTPDELAQVEQWIKEATGYQSTDGYTDETDDEEYEYSETDTEIAAGIAHGDDMLSRQNVRTALTQEIGPLPPIKDPARRAKCKYSLKLACETYFKHAIYLGLAQYQEEMIQAFQDVILKKGKKARAVRRGGLKSTLLRIAIIWGILNGHIKFAIPVGATDDKSNEHRDNIFKMMITSQPLLEDFPELIPLLLKYKNPKKQLRLDGKLIEVSAKDERGCIVFPTLDGIELSEARIAPYSILSTDVSGLAFVSSKGETIRPDFLALDDVQTPQSAKSFLATNSRENAIVTTFMGLAGLGQTMDAVMVCTVREIDDLTNRFCDRKRHPDWDGKKFPVLIKLPDDLKLWSTYEEKLRDGETPEQGHDIATAFYLENRQAMDAGAQIAWEKDKPDEYVSSLQWCMTVRSINPAFFLCELQQEGTAPAQQVAQLSGEDLVKRLSNIPRGTVPDRSSFLTAFIDSSDHVLWWMVCAWEKDFTGVIVDYGTWPDQKMGVFYKSHLRYTLEEQLTGRSWEEAFVHAHNELEKYLLRDWTKEDGTKRQIDLLLKDWSDGGHKARIESQVNASPQKPRIRPSKGFAPKPNKKPVHLWGDAKVDRHTFSNWLEKRTDNPIHVQFDSNKFKSHIARRLTTTPGAPSSLLLPGNDSNELQMLADHLTSEQRKPIIWDGTPGEVWELTPGRDNDWFDTLVGNGVAASMLGCVLSGETTQTNDVKRRVVEIPEHMLKRR